MAARRYRARRSLAIIVGVTAVVLYVTIAVAAWRSPELTTVRALTYVAGAIVWTSLSAMGVIIAARGVRTAGSTILALALAAAGFNSTLEDIRVLTGTLPAWHFPLDVLSGFVAAGAYLRSSQLFPRALTEADMRSPQASWKWLPWLQPALAALLRPWASWAVTGLWMMTSILGSPIVGALANVALILLGALFWRVHARVGNTTVRRRVTWILQTVLVFAMMYLVVSMLMTLLRAAGVGEEARSWVFIAYSVLLAIGGCGSMAMAVFGAGAFNPSLVVRGTVVYGASISLLLFALNVITSIAIDSATDAFGLSDRVVAATLGALAGLLLEPVARTLRHLLERLGRPATEPA
jgi:hypothetical protein